MDLTGVTDVDKLILLNLDDSSLSNVASVNTYISSLIDEHFWASRFYNKYKVTLWKYSASHKSIYREFSKLYGEELVYRVINKGYVELLKTLLNSKHLNKLLIYAVERANFNQLNIVELLLNEGANISAYNDQALMLAASRGHIELVELLLNRGANINAANNQVLYWAIGSGHIKVVELLISRGVNYSGALQTAVRNNHLKIIELLLDKGADIHANYNAALLTAASNGHLKAVELLLNRGADIHANNDYILKAAIKKGHLKVIVLLLDRGATIPSCLRVVNSKLFKLLLYIVKWIIHIILVVNKILGTPKQW